MAQAQGKSIWLSAALLGSLLGAICFGSRAYAIEISVCKKGCDFATIQAAIDAAFEGDTLRVAPGRYAEQITINKSLTIQGAGARATVIDGRGRTRVVTNTGHQVVLSGLTITGGYAKGMGPFDICGGGVLSTEGTLTLRNSIVSKNRAVNGGGICVILDEFHSESERDGIINLERTLVTDNQASALGGGICPCSESGVNIIVS